MCFQSKSMPLVPGLLAGGGGAISGAAAVSPVSVLSSPSSAELQQFDALSQRPRAAAPAAPAALPDNNDPFDLSLLGDDLAPAHPTTVKKSPSAFLGENSSLVNLERLLQPVAEPPAPNPFADVQPPPPVRTTHRTCHC